MAPHESLVECVFVTSLEAVAVVEAEPREALETGVVAGARLAERQALQAPVAVVFEKVALEVAGGRGGQGHALSLGALEDEAWLAGGAGRGVRALEAAGRARLACLGSRIVVELS